MTTRTRRLSVAVAIIAIWLLASVPAVFAQSHGLTLSTRFPGVTVQPGEQVTLSLNVANEIASGPVDLAVTQLPEGWEQPVLRGGGFEVSQVYVLRGGSESVTLDLKVPEDVVEGTYTVEVTARSGAATSTLPLELKVAQAAASRASLTTAYPSIQAQAGTSYTFQVDLRNDSDTRRVFTLSANAPGGWQVSFKPSYESKQVGSFPVDPGASLKIDVGIEVPAEVDKGTYTVPIRASAGSLEARLDLELEVVGKYDLTLSTPSGRLNLDVTAGRENPLELQLKNDGTVPLEKVSLGYTAPPGWTVTFEPKEVDRLAPGESKQVTARVKPDNKALAGDYLLQLSARTKDSSAADSAEFRVAVHTSTWWGLAGLAVLASVGGGLWWVFHTFGRR